MDSLGEHLKRERELRGISLRHISDVTKIHMKYLEALEENHFEALPAEAFTKGFLRSYARCVGIDPDEVILIYKQYLDSQHQEEREESDEKFGRAYRGHLFRWRKRGLNWRRRIRFARRRIGLGSDWRWSGADSFEAV